MLSQYSLECVKKMLWIHIRYGKMRTNIAIDEKLMDEALKATGLKTKKEVIELGLKTLVRLHQQKQIKELKGKLKWDGDLDVMRTS